MSDERSEPLPAQTERTGEQVMPRTGHNTTKQVPAKTPRTARRKHGGPLLLSHTVVIDTREQKPFVFPSEIKTTVATLATGDYSILGLTSQISIERKSWPDFYSCCASDHRRFSEELKRLREIRFADVVVEHGMGYFYKRYNIPQRGGGTVRAALKPESLRKLIVEWTRKYGVSFWFPGSRRRANILAMTLLENSLIRIDGEQQ